MLQSILQIALAPTLVGLSSWASHRWGERLGGILSACPVIVGPFLLISATEHGASFAQHAANGTLAGLIALSGFVLAYGWMALRAGWRTSLAVGWACAAVLSFLSAGLASRPPFGLILTTLTLLAASRALPSRSPGASRSAPRKWQTPSRMALTAGLVASLVLAANLFGSLVGGLLAALPVLASMLAVFTHRETGAAGVLELLHGMLAGMAAFVVFCETIALLIVSDGTTFAFTGATIAGFAAQALVISTERERGPSALGVAPLE